MSTERRTLGWYIAASVEALDAADAAAGRRLRHITRGRAARIELDGEAVRVEFVDGRLAVSETEPSQLPCGTTDSATVVAILDGRLEVHAAIVDSRIDITGADDDVARILCAIEILLDAAPRAPSLQQLAAEFRLSRAPSSETNGEWLSWYPFRPTTSEWRLLQTLDALP